MLCFNFLCQPVSGIPEAGQAPWNLQELCNETFQRTYSPKDGNLCNRTTEILLTERQKLVYGHCQFPNNKPRSDRTTDLKLTDASSGPTVWAPPVPERQTYRSDRATDPSLPCHLRGVAVNPQMAWAPPVPERQISELTLPSDGVAVKPSDGMGTASSRTKEHQEPS